MLWKDTMQLIDFDHAGEADNASLQKERYGTAGCAAPELYTTDQSLDQRTDIYAIGAVLHFMLYGTLNAGAGTDCKAEVSKPLQNVIRKCMEPDREKRYASAKELEQALERLRVPGFEPEILFLDADDKTLVKRYKETRRSHPLSGKGRVDEGIQKEREYLKFLRKSADYILDTSQLLTRELKAELEKIFVDNQSFQNMIITVLSFGFKYGIPEDADLVFDVRFLPNPYYIEELRPQTGNNPPVRDYVMRSELAHIFSDKLEDMMRFLIPNYISEGKSQLVIGIGCTGGKHRSVTLANELYNRLNKNGEYGVRIEHRDIEKDAKR